MEMTQGLDISVFDANNLPSDDVITQMRELIWNSFPESVKADWDKTHRGHIWDIRYFEWEYSNKRVLEVLQSGYTFMGSPEKWAFDVFFIVAMHSDRVIWILHSIIIYPEDWVLFWGMNCVSQDYRRIGIATKLHHVLFEIAKSKWWKERCLMVHEDSHAAIKFDKSLGYEEYKRDEPYIYMRKMIT